MDKKSILGLSDPRINAEGEIAPWRLVQLPPEEKRNFPWGKLLGGAILLAASVLAVLFLVHLFSELHKYK